MWKKQEKIVENMALDMCEMMESTADILGTSSDRNTDSYSAVARWTPEQMSIDAGTWW